ncbi:MAG TPA: class D sortase [Terriglobales bacterium]|nr:class D sortase [Terriglobales bacterium]
MQQLKISKVRNSARQLRADLEWQKLRLLFARQRLSVILTIFGAALLCYVGSEYWAMYHEQQALQRRWSEQNQAMSTNASVQPIKDDGLTRVLIPKINLDLIMVEGTNHKALRIGPGHLRNTPEPGDPGNSVISAHRDTFFRHIYELSKGDEIKVRRNGRTYIFAVTGKKIVEPNDVSILKNTADARLTLVTCYPIYYIGPAPQRLIIFSKLVGRSDTHRQQAELPAASEVARQGS